MRNMSGLWAKWRAADAVMPVPVLCMQNDTNASFTTEEALVSFCSRGIEVRDEYAMRA